MLQEPKYVLGDSLGKLDVHISLFLEKSLPEWLSCLKFCDGPFPSNFRIIQLWLFICMGSVICKWKMSCLCTMDFGLYVDLARKTFFVNEWWMCMIFTVFDPTKCKDHTDLFQWAVVIPVHEIHVLTSCRWMVSGIVFFTSQLDLILVLNQKYHRPKKIWPLVIPPCIHVGRFHSPCFFSH